MRNFLQRFKVILCSRQFFWAIIAFFVIESAWIAASAAYPMAFDENFHFGLIKVYSHYWLPFLSSQPPNADAYGAVARDPSYLYHFLMSFPYRLINLFVHGQTAQIVILRFLNIGLFAYGIALFRRVLLRSLLSPALTNLILALFVLLPVVPLIAGQVNYDNLLFPLVGWACLITMKASDEIQKHKPTARALLTLLTLCLFSTLVKYEFLPIFAGIVFFLVYETLGSYHAKWRSLITQLWKNWQILSTRIRLVLAVLFLLSIGMFVQRDGYNLIKFHTFTPNCSTVLNVDSCSSYGPWKFNYYDHKEVVKSKAKGTMNYENPLSYTGWWIYWLWYRTFFAVDGPHSDFQNFPPLPLPAAASLVVGILSIIAVCVYWRRVFRDNPYMLFFLIVTVVYLFALWMEGFLQYRYTGVFEYMNGRYVVPIVLLLIAIMGKPLYELLKRLPVLKTVLALVVLVCFLDGGGTLTFISRSNAKWDWPSSAVIHANDTARQVLHPILFEGKTTYTTHVWMFI